MGLLNQIAVFLAAAVIAIPVFRRFKLGSVLGYLAAGIVIGPAGLGLMSTAETTMHVAEFGIAVDVRHWTGTAALEAVGASKIRLRPG